MRFFKHQFKIILRSPALFFWIIGFPLILTLLFYVSFSNIRNKDFFKTIEVSYVGENLNKKENNFLKLLQGFDYKDDIKLFKLQKDNLEIAKAKLDDGKIKAYLTFKDEKIIIKTKASSCMEVTVLKSVLDEYEFVYQKIGFVTDGKFSELSENEKMYVIKRVSSVENYVKQSGNQKIEPVNNYFFTIIAMTIMLGSSISLALASRLQPRKSQTGIRIAASPYHKSKIMFSSFLVSFITIIFSLIIAFCFMMVLGVKFYNFGYIVLLCLVGTLFSTIFGFFLGYLLRKLKESTAQGIISFVSVFGSFLSGMMISKIKYYIYAYVKPLFYLNPVNLITDSIACLNASSNSFFSLNRYGINILILLAMSGILVIISTIMIRREKYESI